MDRFFIIDASVTMHMIGNVLAKHSLSQEEQKQYVRASFKWMHKLGMLPHFRGAASCYPIWVCDSPPYWRAEVYPEYKATRAKEKPYDIDMIRDLFFEIDFPRLAIAGQEADDLASLYCRLFRQRSLDDQWGHTYLLTVDSDWQGLVNQDITWVGLGGHEPSVRTPDICWEWLNNKHKKQSGRKKKLWEMPEREEFQARAVWDWKIAVGDRADNLPEDSTPGLIDLHRPCEPYDPFDNEEWKMEAWSVMNASKKYTLDDTAKDFELFMGSLGLSPPIGYIHVN